MMEKIARGKCGKINTGGIKLSQDGKEPTYNN
jgi:hypothetical protein